MDDNIPPNLSAPQGVPGAVPPPDNLSTSVPASNVDPLANANPMAQSAPSDPQMGANPVPPAPADLAGPMPEQPQVSDSLSSANNFSPPTSPAIENAPTSVGAPAPQFATPEPATARPPQSMDIQPPAPVDSMQPPSSMPAPADAQPNPLMPVAGSTPSTTQPASPEVSEAPPVQSQSTPLKKSGKGFWIILIGLVALLLILTAILVML